MILVLSRVPPKMTMDEATEVFSQFGKIEDSFVKHGKKRERTFFLSFKKKQSAQKAYDLLNGQTTQLANSKLNRKYGNDTWALRLVEDVPWMEFLEREMFELKTPKSRVAQAIHDAQINAIKFQSRRMTNRLEKSKKSVGEKDQ